MVRNEITVNVNAVEDILKRDYYFRVPLYQRNFSWKSDEHVEELWVDLKNEYESKSKEKYFFGTLMLVNKVDDPNLYTVIDGQQRLTTSLILLAAFRDYFLEVNDTDEVDSINSCLITETTGKNRITLNVYNQDFFANTILSPMKIKEKIQLLNDDSTLKPKNRLLQKAYLVLADKIINYKKDEATQTQELSKMKEHFLRYFTIVENLIDDLQKAYRIFENINNKGLHLAQSDLVKNHLFEIIDIESQSLSLQERADLIIEADEIWQNIIRILEQMKIDESTFLRYYLTSFVRLVGKDDVFKTVKAEYQTKERVDTFLRRLENRVSNLHKLVKPSLDDWNKDQIIVDYLSALRKLGQGAMYPVLLAGIEKFKEQKDIRELIIITTKLFFRAKTVCSRNFSDIERLVDEICTDIRKDDELTVLKIQEKMFSWSQYPLDDEFKVKFKTLDLNDAKARYALSELHYQMSGGRQNATLVLSDKAQIEHIMPQKIKGSSWETDIKNNKGFTNESELDEYKKSNLNKLGNLTLLNYIKNIKNSNKPFSEKKLIYADPNEVQMTQDLSRIPEWADEAIQNRQNTFVPLAVKIWNLEPPKK
jgi:uncharacterized protein with ParB-like and HNH nuclease domain